MYTQATRLSRPSRRQAAVVLVVAAAALVMSHHAAAAIITFDNRTAWEAAVAPFTEEAFDGFTMDASFNNGATVDVGDFTLQGFGDAGNRNRVDFSSQNLVVRVCRGTDTACGGPNNPQGFYIDFDQPSVAWGSDFGTNGSSIRVSADTVVVGRASSQMFFGFVDTMGSFTRVTIDTPPDFNGANSTMDNFVYSDELAVPEPATLALFGIGLAGIGYGRRRARQ